MVFLEDVPQYEVESPSIERHCTTQRYIEEKQYSLPGGPGPRMPIPHDTAAGRVSSIRPPLTDRSADAGAGKHGEESCVIIQSGALTKYEALCPVKSLLQPMSIPTGSSLN